MALTVPLSLLDFPGQMFDLDGHPLAGGFLQFYLAGTTTPQDTFADVNGDAANSNPVQLDSSGFATIFLSPTLYDVVVYDSLMVQLYSIEGVGDPGAIVFAGLGNTQAEGSKNVATGYIVLSTDNLVTTPTGAVAQTMTLPAAADRTSTNLGNGLPLIIMNFLSTTCTVNPDGSDTINTGAAGAAIVLAAGDCGTFYSDGSSAWYMLRSTT